MKSILEEIWYGNISPNDGGRKLSSEEKRIMREMADNHNKLNSLLSDEQKELLERFSDFYWELSAITERELFVYAFRLGAQIAIEVMK